MLVILMLLDPFKLTFASYSNSSIWMFLGYSINPYSPIDSTHEATIQLLLLDALLGLHLASFRGRRYLTNQGRHW